MIRNSTPSRITDPQIQQRRCSSSRGGVSIPASSSNCISAGVNYKIFDRYKESGLEALTDRSRRPWRYGNQLPQQVETAIACESLAFIAFHRLFQERGLPCSIRSDNGVPFGSPNSLFN